MCFSSQEGRPSSRVGAPWGPCGYLPSVEGSPESSGRSLTLTTGGITLLGVLLSIGVSTGFGVSGPWWVRLLAGVGATVALAVVVKLGTAAGKGPLARLANWMIGAPKDP